MFIADAWKQALINKMGEGDGNGGMLSGREATRRSMKGCGNRSKAPRNIASRKPVKHHD